LKRKTLHQLL